MDGQHAGSPSTPLVATPAAPRIVIGQQLGRICSPRELDRVGSRAGRAVASGMEWGYARSKTHVALRQEVDSSESRSNRARGCKVVEQVQRVLGQVGCRSGWESGEEANHPAEDGWLAETPDRTCNADDIREDLLEKARKSAEAKE